MDCKESKTRQTVWKCILFPPKDQVWPSRATTVTQHWPRLDPSQIRSLGQGMLLCFSGKLASHFFLSLICGSEIKKGFCFFSVRHLGCYVLRSRAAKSDCSYCHSYAEEMCNWGVCNTLQEAVVDKTGSALLEQQTGEGMLQGGRWIPRTAAFLYAQIEARGGSSCK